MKWLYVTGRSQSGTPVEEKTERWTVRAKLAAWLMDWLAGLQRRITAAEESEMHRGTEQTKTSHFRRSTQSVMICFLIVLLSFLSLHGSSMLLWTLAAQLFHVFFFGFCQCVTPTDCSRSCSVGKGMESCRSTTTTEEQKVFHTLQKCREDATTFLIMWGENKSNRAKDIWNCLKIT